MTTTFSYQLLLNGQPVGAGATAYDYAHRTHGGFDLTVGGAVFDTVLLASTASGFGTANHLALDTVRASLAAASPDAGSTAALLGLAGAGLAAAAGFSRRRGSSPPT